MGFRYKGKRGDLHKCMYIGAGLAEDLAVEDSRSGVSWLKGSERRFRAFSGSGSRCRVGMFGLEAEAPERHIKI